MQNQNMYSDARAIVLDADVSDKVSALYVGGAGTVTLITATDKAIIFTCVAGAILPLKFRRVTTAGTSATLLVALLG